MSGVIEVEGVPIWDEKPDARGYEVLMSGGIEMEVC